MRNEAVFSRRLSVAAAASEAGAAAAVALAAEAADAAAAEQKRNHLSMTESGTALSMMKGGGTTSGPDTYHERGSILKSEDMRI